MKAMEGIAKGSKKTDSKVMILTTMGNTTTDTKTMLVIIR